MRQNHELRPPAQTIHAAGKRHNFSSSILTIMLLLLAAGWLNPAGRWLVNAAQSGREIRAANATASPGQSLTVAIELNSQGDENAAGFSLNFNPALLSYQSASPGNGVPAGAYPIINAGFAANGRVGFALALPTEQKFQAGTRQVFTIIFNVANNAAGSATLNFGDDPARRDVADVNGNSLPCNFTTGTVTFVQNNPAPVIGGLDPVSREAGSGAFTLTVNGGNFVNGAVVRWQGGDRATTFVNNTRLQAAITASDMAVAGTASVTVFNPAPGGGVSNPAVFTINQVPDNPQPVLTSLEPAARTAGSGAFTLAVNGSGFLNTSSVRWNGVNRSTAFINQNRLTLDVPASDVAAPGAVVITVFNPASSAGRGGGLSNGLTFTITQPPNPAPSVTSLNPSSAFTGSGAFTLTVNGANFVNGAVVRWQGSDRATTFVSATQLQAALSANDIASSGTAGVAVFNPPTNGGGGGLSNAVTFTINPPPNPVPVLNSLAPNTATAGGAAFTLTVNGSNFVSGAVVRWQGNDRATTFVNSTQLQALIPAGDVATVGTANVTAFNPANVSGGGGVSNALIFTINQPPNPPPTLTGLNPNSANAGGAAFTLTVNGSGFIASSAVRWQGNDRATTFVSGTQLQAAIPAGDITSIGTANVTVFNPPSSGGGGGLFYAVCFSICQPPNPVPSLTSLSPASAVAGGAAFTLTVNGANFVNGAVVRWQGGDRATTFVGAAQLRATVTANDIANAGSATIAVFNPAPGGGTSNALTFAINPPPNPVPSLTSLAPNNATAGSAALTLTVNGTNFINGATVRWNGNNRPTTFVSNTQLTAQIPAGDLLSAGTASLTVFQPAPGGGASNALSFAIVATAPTPTLTSLNPSALNAGAGAFTLTVTGTSFVAGSVVRWNGADRATAFVSATQLAALINAADVAVVGTASVTVFNSATNGGGLSNALTFAINQAPNPVPVLASLNPNSANAGSGAFTLAVSGGNFIETAVVRWNGANRPTTFVSTQQLTANIPASDLANVGSAQVTVFNPASSSGGGGASNALTFTINPPVNNLPVLSGLNPGLVFAGGPAFALIVSGSNFNTSSSLRWNGAERQTSFISATQLRASIPASDLANAGTAQLTVFNPGGGGGTSNALPLVIAGPLANLSAASFTGNELSAGMIVAAFGAGLATGVEAANALPLPATLRGTTVRVVDSAGVERPAPLFFVAPPQVNYLLPLGTAPGAATVIVSSGDNKVSAGTVSLAAVAPGLFSANSNGFGVATGSVLRVRDDGSQHFEPLSTLSPTGQPAALPIDLGPATDQLFLVLFGTGFRGRSSLSAVSATIGGVTAEVLYAGAQGSLAGLDQTNIRLPRVLAGRGEVDVVLLVDGRAANTVKVRVK